MKRVGYIAGAVALAPTALAAALPATAQAATAQAAPVHATSQTRPLLRAAGAKTVSLYHSGARAGAAITPALSGCVATSEWNAGADPYSPHLLGDFYGWANVLQFQQKICLGTVKVVNYFLHNNCRDDYFYVFYGNDTYYPEKTVKVCGVAGESVSAGYTYRLEFPMLPKGNIIQVGVNSTYQSLQAFYFSP
jgi:hypothetical protein